MACSFLVSQQHMDFNGYPLDGAKLYCYKNGVQYNTYMDSSLTILNTNPVILNGRGDCDVYWDGTPVTFMLYTEDDVLVRSWDNVSDESSSYSAHISNTSNPHSVTAAQVGTYTKSEIDSKISEAAGGVGTFLGVLTVAQLNQKIQEQSVNDNDYADMSDSGNIAWGEYTLAVAKYDTVIWTGTQWVKRLVRATDSVPQNNSTNLISSGAVYTALGLTYNSANESIKFNGMNF